MSAAVKAPQPTDDDFLDGFLALLPTGPVWPKEPRAFTSETVDENGSPIVLRSTEPVLVQTCRPLIQTYTRNAARAAYLLQDAFPVTPIELLPEWEDTLGLPDPCAGPSPSLQVRQQQVAARFVAAGGQTTAYFISVAATLGYPITITEFAPFRVGQPVGQPLYGDAWTHVWQVNAPTFTIKRFEVGRDTVGEALASWGNTVLQCELNRLKPAQTPLLFNYS